MRFSGKHVVVTGAASGLGLAIAKAAQAEGATIIATGPRRRAVREQPHLRHRR